MGRKSYIEIAREKVIKGNFFLSHQAQIEHGEERIGFLEDKKVTVDFRWGNKLVVIEEVPAKVCNECWEK